ncbi:uncharacterized protein LOC128866199 [Anastrepha ludens]|uniref:uncharacterized protein LOC128866199 n=1 Tax=Anastrepha ludens TaxID=28586 RepID=UPI0023B1EE8E|nr:uncharacterized protein LOC128866199 [Anastrepha ludens]XP_053962712.1 uncharacterized protein LOC128866199 [Anastrepha ludens]XP_053962713.1 uncharacterized protein LOC128866199 [Anastrepha ludens]
MADTGNNEGETPAQPPSPPQQQQPQPAANNPNANVNVPNIANVWNVDLTANPFNFNNNRNRGGQNNLMNVRDRLFHAIYFKVALMYAQVFPKPLQRALEYLILLKALLFFFALVYIHLTFIKNPATCLQNVKDWPREGVLRVEVIPNLEKHRDLLSKTKANEQLVRYLQNYYHYGIGPQTKVNHYRLKEYERKLTRAGYQLRPTFTYANETLIYYFKTEAISEQALANSAEDKIEKHENDDDEQYIVEYSLEYGHLRLSSSTRKRLKIPVRVVQLDPMTDKCFGDKFSKFLLKQLLGYDDLLMASVRVIAEKEDNKGYLRNVITGEHYRFVSMWWAAWSSYLTAFFVMVLFTFSISMLLRFSHHQIFVFIVDLLQMLEFNVTARFPIAPLLTVILALVGMESIMSEFFNDTTTAFYIILIVWVADQYDAICCHTSITKRHWLRFFYLYHFAFYAYHYRFSGQNRSLALLSSWLFIQHSMFYFFHRYELPVIIQQAQILIITNNQNVAGNGPQQQQQLQGQGRPAAILMGRLFRRPAQQQQQHQQLIDALRNQRQIPFVGGLLQRRVGAVDTLRRTLLQRGWIGAPRVRVQIANLQRINLRSIQINPANLGAATAAADSTGEAATGGAGNGSDGTDGNVTITQVSNTDSSTSGATESSANGGSGQTIGITISFNAPTEGDVDARSTTGMSNDEPTPLATTSLDAMSADATANAATETQSASTTITGVGCVDSNEGQVDQNDANFNAPVTLPENYKNIRKESLPSSIESQSKLDTNKESILNEENKNTDDSLSSGSFAIANGCATTENLVDELSPVRATSVSTETQNTEISKELLAANELLEESPQTVQSAQEVVAILNTAIPQPSLLPRAAINQQPSESISSTTILTAATSPISLAAPQNTQPASMHASPSVASVVPISSSSLMASALNDNFEVNDGKDRSGSANIKLVNQLNATNDSTTETQAIAASSDPDGDYNPQETPAAMCDVSLK